MTEKEVEEYRKKELEGVKIRGLDCPRPLKKWNQAGLPPQVHRVIERLGFEKPFPIQAQAIPAIMSGRDVIACAKTVRRCSRGDGVLPLRSSSHGFCIDSFAFPLFASPSFSLRLLVCVCVCVCSGLG